MVCGQNLPISTARRSQHFEQQSLGISQDLSFSCGSEKSPSFVAIIHWFLPEILSWLCYKILVRVKSVVGDQLPVSKKSSGRIGPYSFKRLRASPFDFCHADTSTFLTELSVVPYGLHTSQGNVLKEDLLFHIGFQSSLRRGRMSQLFLSVFGPYWLRGWLMPLLKGQF